MMGPYRNHPVQLVKSAIGSAVMAVILVLATERMEIAILGLIPFFFAYRIWHLTTYTFTEEGVDVSKNTAFKNERNIPYSKVSSVNLTRSVVDRIIGTTTVSLNINSGVNAASPEMSLVLRKDRAEELRAFVEMRIHGSESISEEGEMEHVYVTFTDIEVIMHSFLSMQTGNIISSLFFLGYSILAFIGNNSGMSGMFGMIFFVATLAIPIVRQLVRYFNFRAYRSGDTIFLEHGLFQTYRSSFDVSRINAVHIQRPLFARMLGRSSIQAEVVGINAMSNDSTPTLCLMTSEAHNRSIMEMLLPEFIDSGEITLQPRSAGKPLFVKALIYSLTASAIAAAICITAVMNRTEIIEGINEMVYFAIVIFPIVLALLISFTSLYGCVVSLRSIGYRFGEDKLTFVFGVVDRKTTIMQYDRIQMASEVNGPISRRYGLSKCQISFLSSFGSTGGAQSGYMKDEDARAISETVLARIRDGRYDYSKYEI